MTTINLHQDQQQEDNSRFTMKGGNGGFFFSLGILVLTLLVFAVLKWYIPFAQAKNDILAQTISTENTKLVGLTSLENIVDLQSRLSEIKNNLQIKDGAVTRYEMTGILDHLAGDLNAGVTVSDFKYSNDGTVLALFSAGNFSDIAKQILNFKNSDYFTKINVSNIARREAGINFNVEMKIKN